MILHQPPFLFVGDIRQDQPLEVWAHFPAGNPYLADEVPRTILIEAMAQGVAVFAGRQAGKPRAGVLAMLKRVAFFSTVRRETRVFLRVAPGRHFGRLQVFHTEAHVDGGAMIASSEVVVAQT